MSTPNPLAGSAVAVDHNTKADDDHKGHDHGASGKSGCVLVQMPNGKNGGHKAYTKKNPYANTTVQEFNAKVEEIFHSDVYCFSGSADSQVSADVYDVASFGLPAVDPNKPENSGGAMTNALQAVLSKNANVTFGNALVEMRTLLKEKKYSQVPQLSCSHQIDLKTQHFSVINPREKPGVNKRKALCIGINYIGENPGELNGCINDCKSWVRYLATQGFEVDNPECVRILTDDKEYTPNALPDTQNIIKAMRWLVKDAKDGDSLFFSVSGHGVQLPCTDHEKEPDGYDEALAPLFHQLDGYIRDSAIFKELVAPLPGGCRLVAIVDCCHSGTLLDLPFTACFDDNTAAAFVSGKLDSLMANALFSFEAAKGFINEVASGLWDAFLDARKTIRRHWCCC